MGHTKEEPLPTYRCIVFKTASGLDTRFISGVISGNEGLITVLQIGALLSMPESRKSPAL